MSPGERLASGADSGGTGRPPACPGHAYRPVVNPLIFYPWRVYDFGKVAFRWIKLVRRYRGMMKRVLSDPAIKSYSDHALDPPAGHNAPMSDFVKTYADKIPHTHGAPVQEAVLN